MPQAPPTPHMAWLSADEAHLPQLKQELADLKRKEIVSDFGLGPVVAPPSDAMGTPNQATDAKAILFFVVSGRGRYGQGPEEFRREIERWAAGALSDHTCKVCAENGKVLLVEVQTWRPLDKQESERPPRHPEAQSERGTADEPGAEPTELQGATYADLEAAPPHRVAELIDGVLYTFPRPAPRHARASTALGSEIFDPFDRGRNGPGGWHILHEPEIHFRPRERAVVPDLAGWRRERLPRLPEENFFRLAPDWVCEVLSPSTMAHDKARKRPLYAREGVPNLWLVDPVARTLEVHVLGADGLYNVTGTYHGSARVRAEPFETLELDLALLWAE